MSTIRDVARLANVSTATVSRVLNKDTTYKMTEKTRLSVLDAVSELNYAIPTSHKDAKRKAKTSIKNAKIGCILRVTKKGYNDPYYMSVLNGIESSLRTSGIDLRFIKVAPLLYNKEQFDSIFRETLDGLILMDPLSDSLYPALKSKASIIVGIDTLRDDIDDVGYDHLLSGIQAVELLIRKGHKKIGFLGGSAEGGTIHDSKRFQGYLLAMVKAGLPMRREWIIDCEWKEELCMQKVDALCKESELPTAVFAASDLMAMAAMNSFYKNGVRVPEQISVIGMSNIEMSQYANPPLTTFHVPKEEIGQTAVRLLLSRINGEHTLPQKVLLPTTYIERSSVKELC